MHKIIWLILSAILIVRIFHTLGYNVNKWKDTRSYEKGGYYVNESVSESPNSIWQKWDDKVTNRVTRIARRYLPSPHSELLLGLLIGLDDIKKTPLYYETLIQTGTVHVVVVSGYNITLVFNFIISLLGTRYKIRNIIFAETVTFLYALLSGLEPPVLRAWIMGSVISLGKYYGRVLDAKEVLIFSAYIMMLVQPQLITSISFQLSFLATLSLVLYNGRVKTIIKQIKPEIDRSHGNNVFLDDLASTVSAQILVWPVISYYFGRVSILSPLVNCLVLWTVPLSTVVGSIFIFVASVVPILGQALAWFVLVPLDIFVITTALFGKYKFASVSFKMEGKSLFLYYSALIIVPHLYKCFHRNIKSTTKDK